MTARDVTPSRRAIGRAAGPSASATSDATPRPRELWPDVAKGLCIVLVVLWHVVTKHHADVEWSSDQVPTAWSFAMAQLLPLRMPLFFAVSGVFAASAVAASWRTLLRQRCGRFGALYALWLLIHTAVLALTPDFDTARARNVGELAEQLLISPTNLWYLYALALYFLVAKLTSRVPAAWLLPVAFAVSAAASAGLVPAGGNRWQVLQNLVFFLAALRLRGPLRRWAERATMAHAAAALVVFVGASGAMGVWDLRGVFGVWTVVSGTAVLFGVAGVAVLARRVPRGARALAWLGARTLPIYVLHLPLLAVVDRALDGLGGSLVPSGAVGLVAAAVEPLVLTALLVTLCLLLHRGLLAVGLGRMFDPVRARR